MGVLNVAFIVDLDQHIPVALIENPSNRVIDSAQDSRLILQAVSLPEIENSQQDYHPQFVCPIQDTRQAGQICLAEFALLVQAGVVPGLAA